MSSKAWLLLLITVTLPISFGAIAFWIVREGNRELEATIAGGLIGILSAIVSGFFHTIQSFNDKDRGRD